MDPTFSRDSVEIRRGATIVQSLRDVLVPGLCVWMTLMITLTLFPALLQPIRPLEFSPTDRWTCKFMVQ